MDNSFVCYYYTYWVLMRDFSCTHAAVWSAGWPPTESPASVNTRIKELEWLVFTHHFSMFLLG